ncbi:hypothetical protein LINGRAPRIM_LOCUS1350, partial [Linum grandiflorum]
MAAAPVSQLLVLFLLSSIVISATASVMARRAGLYATLRNNTVQPQRGGAHGGGAHGGGGGRGEGGGGEGGDGQGHGGNQGGGNGGSPGVVTWQSRCSDQRQTLPTSDARAAQCEIMREFSANVGCSSKDFSFDGGLTAVRVYITFTCTMQPPDQCSACFDGAVKGMQDMCPGRAGAVVSDNVNC